uniref:RSE1/DDB1/CPSF1 C-terminal domain-containing protein n=1 Tax=Pyramimonas obovata TaxID=1411642 RepID=A0A7S0MRB0_9CHLO|mmetsp:Transcript_11550/g.24191  ORF Transcript_11550/g.24191 Transcript_11550/m.24191 type:complete len:372 (+) Transcript_11550:86-1201(+)
MTPTQQFGAPKDVDGQWASCIQVVDMKECAVTSSIELQGNEVALTACACTFSKLPGQQLVAVATTTDLTFYPREASGGFIHLYRAVDNGRSLQLLHKTPTDGIIACICAFQDKLVVGMGRTLRMYDLGKKKLLRKCELRTLPTFITGVQAMGDRLYVSDNQHSLHYVKYRSKDNSLYVFADDITPRWVTSALPLDYNTVAAGDKFGNLVVLRLPTEISDEVEEDPTGGKMIGSQAHLNGAPNKLEALVQFHVGETVLSLARTELQPGGQEVLLYGTVMGGIGAMLPFTSREDVDFFNHLEMHLRQENAPLCGRDHMAYRSYYFPVKDVIDGDLCEQYATLSAELQRKIADELDRTPSEILKKLEDIRQKIC